MSTPTKVSMGEQRAKATGRPDLQGMRAIAVLAVFADHLFSWPTGGFVGVDIFFVLSGFFITGKLISERDRTGSISFKTFYIKRARRILPSALLVVGVTVAASYAIFPATRAKETMVDGLYAVAFAANLHFQQTGTDYFQSGQPPSPLQHYWSLSIEEQFYFAWPAILLGLYLATRRLHRRGVTWVRKAAIATAMFAICAASFAWAILQTSTVPAAAYFSTFTRVWELGIGALLAICGPLFSKIPDRLRPLLSYIGLAGVAASLMIVDSGSNFPAPWAAMPVLSTALIVVSFHGRPVVSQPLLTNRLSRYVGDVSYTLYLWHWPVIIIAAAAVPTGGPYFVLVITLASLLTAGTYHLYENPIRRSSWLEADTVVPYSTRRLQITPATWALVGFMLASAVIAGGMVVQLEERESGNQEANEVLLVPGTRTPTASTAVDPCFGAAALTNLTCTASKSDQLRPSIDSFPRDTQGAFACWRSNGDSIRPCDYGPTEQDVTRIALVGDSHAAMLLPALADELTDRRWRLTVFTGDGCRWQMNLGGDCAEEVDRIQSLFLNDEPYDLIVTTASRKYGSPDTAAAAKDFSDMWTPISARGTRILAVSDSPEVSQETLACLTRLGTNPIECSTVRDDALRTQDPLISAASFTPGATALDLTDRYCAQSICPAVIGRVIVYRDSEAHITATYMKTLTPYIADAIEQALK